MVCTLYCSYFVFGFFPLGFFLIENHFYTLHYVHNSPPFPLNHPFPQPLFKLHTLFLTLLRKHTGKKFTKGGKQNEQINTQTTKCRELELQTQIHREPIKIQNLKAKNTSKRPVRFKGKKKRHA